MDTAAFQNHHHNNSEDDRNSETTDTQQSSPERPPHPSDESFEEETFDYSDVEGGEDDDDDIQGEDEDEEDNHNNHDRIEPDAATNMTSSRPHKLSQDFETTALDRHIQRMDWPAVLRRIKIYPQECSTVDMTNGHTPLHVACHAGAPAVIVQSLCQAYPEASIRTDRCNMNPLHITCSSNNASLSTVHALLHHGASEQISMRDVDGDTPLHAACRCGANKDVIDYLLQAYPGAVHVHDFEGFTPLVRLWIRYYVILGEAEIHHALVYPSVLDTDVRFVTAWDQTLLLLRYAHGSETRTTATAGAAAAASSSSSSAGSLTTKPTSIYATSTSFRQQIRSTVQHRLLSPSSSAIAMNSMLLESETDPPSTMFVLHAVSAVDCPRFVVQLAIRKYPMQLLQRDEHGRSPLMVACAAPIYSYHSLSDDLFSWIEADDEDIHARGRRHDQGPDANSTPPVGRMPESKSSVIELILQAGKCLSEFTQSSTDEQLTMKYGGADWVDPSGRLPLHIAIESGKTWKDGIDALIQAYPESIGITDRSTKLYPYQLAATKAIANDHASNDCYQLLRLNPTVLSMGNSASFRSDSNTSSPLTTIRTELDVTTTADDTDLLVPLYDIDTSNNERDENPIPHKRHKC